MEQHINVNILFQLLLETCHIEIFDVHHIYYVMSLRVYIYSYGTEELPKGISSEIMLATLNVVDKIRTVDGSLLGTTFAIVPEDSDTKLYGSLMIDAGEAALFVKNNFKITMPIDTLKKPLQRVMTLNGAVLVSGVSGRIVGVGVQLEHTPLKQTYIVKQKITESCDSVVIIRGNDGNVTISTSAISPTKKSHKVCSSFSLINSVTYGDHANFLYFFLLLSEC